jgi:hypothetical protein
MSRLRTLFSGGSDGNARLTAATGVVLLVLLAAEGLTLIGGVGRFLVPHVFIGLLVIPPILLKLGSTSWRMMRYYRRAEEYVRRGPPQVLLRMLVAPVLVAATAVLLVTGIVAVLVGHGGFWLGLHKTSFVVWGIAFGVHVLAHVLELPRLVAGLVVALAAFPLARHWHGGFSFRGGD